MKMHCFWIFFIYRLLQEQEAERQRQLREEIVVLRAIEFEKEQRIKAENAEKIKLEIQKEKEAAMCKPADKVWRRAVPIDSVCCFFHLLFNRFI